MSVKREERFTFRLSEVELLRLKVRAAQRGMTASEFVRQATISALVPAQRGRAKEEP